MSDPRIVAEVEAAVQRIWDQKEEKERRAAVEKALNEAKSTISELTESLETKDAEYAEKIEGLSAELEKAKSELEEMKNQLEAVTKEKSELESRMDELKEQAEAAEKTLAELRKDRATDVRMQKLADAKVLFENEEARTRQREKVREMSDEAFEEYLTDLKLVRSSVEAEISVEDDTGNDRTDKESETGSEEESMSGMSPADTEQAQKVLAALNLEMAVPESLQDKYDAIWKDSEKSQE